MLCWWVESDFFMALGTLCLVYAFSGYPFRRQRMSSNKFCCFVVVISEEQR